MMGLQDDIPAALGSDLPMEDRCTPRPSAAAELIIERVLADEEEPLYVLALGQFTNLASALLIEPKIRERAVFACIDGDYRHGRTPAWGRGIYNWKNDVAAVQAIFESDIPYIHMPARSVSEAMYIERREVARRLQGRGPVCDYLVSLWDEPRFRDVKGRILWDIALVHVMIDPEHGRPVETGAPVVYDDGTTSDHPDNPRRVTVYAEIDAAEIYERFWQAVEGWKRRA